MPESAGHIVTGENEQTEQYRTICVNARWFPCLTIAHTTNKMSVRITIIVTAFRTTNNDGY